MFHFMIYLGYVFFLLLINISFLKQCLWSNFEERYCEMVFEIPCSAEKVGELSSHNDYVICFEDIMLCWALIMVGY